MGYRVGSLCTSQPRREFPFILRCMSNFRDFGVWVRDRFLTLNRDEPSRALRVFGFRQPARAFGQVPIVLRRLPSGSPTRGKSEIVRARGTQFGSADRKEVPVDMCLAPGLAGSGCVDACEGCSFASMVETRSATIEDAERISALLAANASDRGGDEVDHRRGADHRCDGWAKARWGTVYV